MDGGADGDFEDASAPASANEFRKGSKAAAGFRDSPVEGEGWVGRKVRRSDRARELGVAGEGIEGMLGEEGVIVEAVLPTSGGGGSNGGERLAVGQDGAAVLGVVLLRGVQWRE